jgi:chromosome segregation ATPase
VQALDEGDELARVWQQVRDRDAQLVDANTALKELRRERDQARREFAGEQGRWGWIESRNTGLVAERDRLETERDALAVEVAELRERLAWLTHSAARPVVDAPAAAAQRALSRAQRRQLERQQRRRQP